MNSTLPQEFTLSSGPEGIDSMAVSASVANRTHRVVRQRANLMRARRNRARSLSIPLLIGSGLLAVLCAAVWSVLDQYDPAANGVPDASQQLTVFIVWSLPLTAGLLALIWFRKTCKRMEETERP